MIISFTIVLLFEGLLEAHASKLSNQARFIVEKIDGIIKMENVKKRAIITQLLERKYDPDPVKMWKKRQDQEENDEENLQEETETENEGNVEDPVMRRLGDFDYLVQMALIRVSSEEKEKLLKERDVKIAELELLKGKTPSDLWLEDLKAFEEALEKQEQKEREDANGSKKSGKAKLPTGKSMKKAAEYMPSTHATRIEPKIDPLMKQRLEKADQNKTRKKKVCNHFCSPSLKILVSFVCSSTGERGRRWRHE